MLTQFLIYKHILHNSPHFLFIRQSTKRTLARQDYLQPESKASKRGLNALHPEQASRKQLAKETGIPEI